MTITFYHFSKRSNSTKQVDVSGTTFSNCELKGETSMIAPVLLIKAVPTNWSPEWNYCYIPGFHRYYFVNDWRWLNGVWECSLVIDVLATYKTEIGNLTEFVERSSYESDGYIVDTAYVTKSDVRCYKDLLPAYFYSSLPSGFYILGVIGREQDATQGAVTYYQMSGADLGRLRAYLLDDQFLTDQGLVNLADFIPAAATKVIYNPYQYIVSCKWYPFDMSVIDSAYKTAVTRIYFGWWTTGTLFNAYMLKPSVPGYERVDDIAVHTHPQMSRGDYLNRAPFTERILRFFPFGDIQISDSAINNNSVIRLRFTVEFIEGVGVLSVEIYNTTGLNQGSFLVARESAQIGVDIQLAQVGKDYYGAESTRVKNAMYEFNNMIGQNIDLSSLGGLIESGFKAGTAFSQIDSYDTYVAKGDYLKASAPLMMTSGTNGSLAAYKVSNYLITNCYILEDEDNTRLGRPLATVKVLNTIPGFIIVKSPDVDIACFEQERSLIKAFLSGGFFYE